MIDHKELRRLANPNNAKYLDNFFSKIAPQESGCWLWTASTAGKPGRKYGCFWNGSIIKAHRFSHQTWNGQLLDGLIICHHCDNPLCVNPAHLYQGTHSDNAQDAVKRNRHRNGELEKTHCPKGHPYAGANLREYKGTRLCKTCRDIHRGRTPKVYF